MKNKSLLLFTALGVGALLSCKKQLDDAYANPNAPVKVAVEELLPPMAYNMGQNIQRDERYLGSYIQNWHDRRIFSGGVNATYFDRMGYVAGSDAAGDIWRMHYWLLGQNVNKMIEWGTDEKKWDFVGVGYAIQAWSWLTLTDYHGDVILKDAFNTNLLTFKYDTQDEVYAYVRELCQKALTNLSKTGDGVNQANLAKSDAFFYKGDIDKWKKFTYGVLARSFHHLTDKSDYKADSVIKYCDLSLASTDDDATVKFAASGSSDEYSFFGPYRGNISNYRQSKFIADLMTGANPTFNGVADPRAWYLLRTNDNGTFKGIEPGKGINALDPGDRPENFWGGTVANPFPDDDSKAKYIFRDNAEMPIMTATEVQFMKAEAQYLSGDKAGALDSYKKAISLDFDMLITHFNQNIPAGHELTTADRDAFLANTAVVPTSPSALTLSQIMLQKYIALYGYGMTETWVDLRRYHYTDIDPATGSQVYNTFTPPNPLDPQNGGKLVYRVRPRYNSESIWNAEELKRIGADQPDYHTKVIWFAQP